MCQVYCIRLTKKCIRFFTRLRNCTRKKSTRFLRIFDFLTGWTLKFSAFGNAVKKIQFFYDRDRFVQYNIDHIMQTSFTALYNQEVNVILLYWCRSSDLITSKRQKSELAKGYATLPTPLLSFSYIRLHDWICMYTLLFISLVLCTRFQIVPGFLLPGFLSFLKCTRFQSTRYLKKVSGLRYQVGESTRWKVPVLVLFWTTW